MIVIVATFEFPIHWRERVLELARRMDEETNREDGCVHYRHATDVSADGRLVLSEVWRDANCLRAHFRTPHFRTFRSAAKEIGIRATVRQYKGSEVAQRDMEHWRSLLPEREARG